MPKRTDDTQVTQVRTGLVSFVWLGHTLVLKTKAGGRYLFSCAGHCCTQPLGITIEMGGADVEHVTEKGYT